jgi:hypothetical protein
MSSDFPLLSVFLYMLWFFALVLWLYLLVAVVTDVFRSRDLSGWAKAAWTIGIIVLPVFGVLAYLVIRGESMHERMQAQVDREQQSVQEYLRQSVGTPASSADELQKLAELRDRGVLSPTEFDREKSKILA